MSVNKDICNIGPNKKQIKESITAHKLALAILIRQFCQHREGAGVKAIHRRDFCIVILKLIQSPDMTLPELRQLLLSGKYNIEPVFVEKFDNCLRDLYVVGVGYLLDLAEYISRLTIDVQINGIWCQINKNSILGCYLRRLMVFFDKLSFAKVTALYEEFKEYFKPCEKEIIKRLHFPQRGELRPEEAQPAPDPFPELEQQQQQQQEQEEEEEEEEKSEQWSRKQAELFIATQAALLSTNEGGALAPADLQKQISTLLKTNPDLAEAHFLSYLNYVRVREFCGALDSLVHCFDRCSAPADHKGAPTEDRSRSLRYAALNLAALYAQFGHKEEAMAALKESVRIAQEAGDNVCLQYALMWMYRLADRNKELLIEHSILKSTEFSLTYVASLGIQAYTQYAGLSAGNPRQIFETMTKSDVLNSQHSYRDLMSSSHAQKAALWAAYGRPALSALWAQALLHLNADHLALGQAYRGEGTCLALCASGTALAREGRCAAAAAVLQCARAAFPREPLAHAWLRADALCAAERHTLRAEWARAEDACRALAAADPCEARLRLGAVCVARADYCTALVHLHHVLDGAAGVSALPAERRVRALMLVASAQCLSEAQQAPPASVLTVLHSALATAHAHHFDQLAALLQLHVAAVQLAMHMPAHALRLLRATLARVLAHGTRYERACSMLLYVRCVVAAAAAEAIPGVPPTSTHRLETLREAANLLRSVNDDFRQLQAWSRLRDSLYLQALIYNEVDAMDERNSCALEYKECGLEYPAPHSRYLLTSF